MSEAVPNLVTFEIGDNLADLCFYTLSALVVMFLGSRAIRATKQVAVYYIDEGFKRYDA